MDIEARKELFSGGNEDDSLERRLQADAKDFEFFDGLDWNYEPDICVRLRNETEVDEFLQKLLS